jgi:hypothetical protein
MLLALEQKVVRSHVCFEPITTLLCDCLSDTFQPHRPTAARSSKALPLLSLCVTKIQGNEAFRLRKVESGTLCSRIEARSLRGPSDRPVINKKTCPNVADLQQTFAVPVQRIYSAFAIANPYRPTATLRRGPRLQFLCSAMCNWSMWS